MQNVLLFQIAYFVTLAPNSNLLDTGDIAQYVNLIESSSYRKLQMQ